MEINALILAGGSGTRLWPLSRSSHPKQFLELNDRQTLIQSTVERLSNLNIKEITTICNDNHRFFVAVFKIMKKPIEHFRNIIPF